MANFAIGGLINELLEKYDAYKEIIKHIKQIKERVIEHAEEFLPRDSQEPTSFVEAISQQRDSQTALMEKFKVNLIIDNKDSEGAPVILKTIQVV
jgi:hypothetical protein